MLPEEMNLFLYDAMISDLDLQLIENSESLRLAQKQSSNTIQEIQYKYGQEKERVRNEMKGQDDKLSNEYMELLQELNEISDKESAEVAAQEQEANDYESKMEIQNENIETRRNAAKEDRDAIKKALEDDVKDSFSLFE